MGSVFERLKAWFRGPEKEEESVSYAEPEEPIAEHEEPVHAFVREGYTPYEAPEEPASELYEPAYPFMREEHTPYEELEEHVAESEEPEKEPEEPDPTTFAKAASFLKKREVEA